VYTTEAAATTRTEAHIGKFVTEKHGKIYIFTDIYGKTKA
jgi:hypothetical protein